MERQKSTERIFVRLSPALHTELKTYARNNDKSKFRVIKEFIKSLESKNKEVAHEKTN